MSKNVVDLLDPTLVGSKKGVHGPIKPLPQPSDALLNFFRCCELRRRRLGRGGGVPELGRPRLIRISLLKKLIKIPWGIGPALSFGPDNMRRSLTALQGEIQCVPPSKTKIKS